MLHIQSIRRAVLMRRPEVNEGSIDAIVSRSVACFESLGNGLWKFNAAYIECGYRAMNSAVHLYNRWLSPQKRTTLPQQPALKMASKPHPMREIDAKRTKEQKPDAVVEDGIPDFVHMTELSLSLDLWDFLSYVPSGLVERQHEIMRLTASHYESQLKPDVSLALYQILQKRGLSTFSTDVERLAQQIKWAGFVQAAQAMPIDSSERWNRWFEVWQKYQELPTVRATLLKDIRDSAMEMAKVVNVSLRQNLEAVSSSYILWLRGVGQFWHLWQQEEVKLLGKSLPLLFDTLVNNEAFDLVVALIAACPKDSKLLKTKEYLDIHKYLYAVEQLADWLEKHKEQRVADVLLFYGLHQADESEQRLIDVKELSHRVEAMQVSIDDLQDVYENQEYTDFFNPLLIQQIIQEQA